MGAAEDKEKLKELQDSLAEELDQDINLTEPSDSRLSDNVHLNPNISDPSAENQTVTSEEGEQESTKEKFANAKNKKKEKNDQSEEEVDEEELERQKAQQEVEESLALIDQAEDGPGAAPKKTSIVDKISDGVSEIIGLVIKPFQPILGILGKVLGKPYSKLRDAYGRLPSFKEIISNYAVKWLKVALQKASGGALTQAKKLAALTKNGVKSFVSLSLVQKVKLIFILLMSGITLWTTKFLLHSTFLPEIKSTYINDLHSEGTKNVKVPAGEEVEDYKSPMRHPEYMLLIDKVTVNLTPDSTSSRNPMLFFEVFLNASSQEGAVELKVRMSEVRDGLQRVAENFRYEELKGVEGKKRLKIALKQRLNDFLNNGTVTEIYFNTFILKY